VLKPPKHYDINSQGGGDPLEDRNIENFVQEKGTLNLVVDVITSDQIFTMCGKCANKRSASHAEKILETTQRFSDPQLN